MTRRRLLYGSGVGYYSLESENTSFTNICVAIGGIRRYRRHRHREEVIHMFDFAKSTSLPKWVWNAPLDEMTEEGIIQQFTGFRDRDGYDGVMIVPWGVNGYMSERYFELYGIALRTARELGMKIIIWDENGFPSGYANGEIDEKYPEHTAHRIDMIEYTARGGTFSLKVNTSGFEGAVALERSSFKRVDISSSLNADGTLSCPLPDGDWRIMVFYCVQAEPAPNVFWKNRRLVDYLSADAVRKLIDLTHERYFQRFAPYFGATITHAFYDEPAFWHVEGGRLWSPCFKKAFADRYGFSHVDYYPALFDDVGPDTAKMRNALLRLRSDMYRDNYVGQLTDWCKAHGIILTGHMDQEEIPNPISISGDLLKLLGRSDIPGADEIGWYRRGTKAYKIASSAAANYGKERVMNEVFGDMGEDMPENVMIKEAIDLTAKGVDLMVPHGTWYSTCPDRILCPPELSFRSQKFAQPLAEFNRFVKACRSRLEGMRLKTSAAVLYPIDDLYAAYSFGGENKAYKGGRFPEYTDYLDIGEALSVQCRRDFIYLHPEVLAERCHVEDGRISLENVAVNAQIQVMVLPSCRTVDRVAYRRLLDFINSGGVLVACGTLPEQASDGDDEVVRRITAELFADVAPQVGSFTRRILPKRGKTYRLNGFDHGVFALVEEDAGVVHDILLEAPQEMINGFITCMHRSGPEGDAVFIGNSSDVSVTGRLFIQGDHAMRIYNPHNDTLIAASTQSVQRRGQRYTCLDLELISLRSVIVEFGFNGS